MAALTFYVPGATAQKKVGTRNPLYPDGPRWSLPCSPFQTLADVLTGADAEFPFSLFPTFYGGLCENGVSRCQRVSTLHRFF